MKLLYSLLVASVFFVCACNSGTNSQSVSGQDSIQHAKGLVSLANEKNIATLLCQGWVMDDDKDVIKISGEAEGMFPYRCFYLFDDSTYTKNVRNTMEYGQWSYNDAEKTFTLKNNNRTLDQYKILAIRPDDMIAVNDKTSGNAKLHFISSGKKYANKNEDPFYIGNNQWRIKPTASESDEQIRKRLKDYLHFCILFYRDNLAKGEKSISFYGLPSCVRWYKKGIELIKKDALPPNWFACFYNNEQAMKAHKLMSDALLKKYKWPEEKMSWVKMNLIVLQQIDAGI